MGIDKKIPIVTINKNMGIIILNEMIKVKKN